MTEARAISDGLVDLKALIEAAKKAYHVTEDGRVISRTNWRGYGERELRQYLNDDGYPSVHLSIDGRRVHLPVHRLVAAFHLNPRPSPAHEIRHLDGDKANNHRSNLAWGTRSENALDRQRHGTERCTENAIRKLSPGDVDEIRRRRVAGEPLHAIAKDFPHVHLTTVGCAARGVTHSRREAVS